MVAKVEEPIIIVGVGRSGSTVFHRILSRHPHVAWLSPLCDRYPDKPSLNRLLTQMIDIPVIGKGLAVNPSECYGFWEYHCKGFSCPCRDLLAGDVTNRTKAAVRTAMAKMLTNARSRLLLRVTGWPRIGFLREVFTDAKFIHMVRDGRAIVNSMISVGFWWGWRGPQNWRYGELTPAQMEEWDTYDRSFVVLACIEWKMLMEAVRKARRLLPTDDFLEVRYEDLCAKPLSVLRSVAEFCNLEWSERFGRSIQKYSLTNRNYKWRADLTADQQRMVQEVLGDSLARYGYS